MDEPQPGTVPHLRDASGRQVIRDTAHGRHMSGNSGKKAGNLRTALILLSVAAVFFLGVIAKRWLFGG